MEDSNLALPGAPVAAPIVAVRARPLAKWLAILEVLAVSGIPTQLLVFIVLWFTSNINAFDEAGQLSLEFVAIGLLLDTALIALMIRVFLALNGEDSRDVFIGQRRVVGEVLRGLAWLPVVLIAVTALALALRAILPGLHTVEENPYARFMQTPVEGVVFGIVVILSGGVKEELQRGFILSRFEQSLGGMRLGLIITTLVFGLLHYPQGADGAIVIGLLGLFWGLLYARRRSAVMAMTNHAAFDSAQVLQYVLVKALGG